MVVYYYCLYLCIDIDNRRRPNFWATIKCDIRV